MHEPLWSQKPLGEQDRLEDADVSDLSHFSPQKYLKVVQNECHFCGRNFLPAGDISCDNYWSSVAFAGDMRAGWRDEPAFVMYFPII